MCQREKKQKHLVTTRNKRKILKSFEHFNTLYLFREIENGNVDEFERKWHQACNLINFLDFLFCFELEFLVMLQLKAQFSIATALPDAYFKRWVFIVVFWNIMFSLIYRLERIQRLSAIIISMGLVSFIIQTCQILSYRVRPLFLVLLALAWLSIAC